VLYGCEKPPMQKGNRTRRPGEGPQPPRPNKLSAYVITRRWLITPSYLPTITQAEHMLNFLFFCVEILPCLVPPKDDIDFLRIFSWENK
jgi:hypothetical protein